MNSKLTVHLLSNSTGAPVVVAAGVKFAKLVSNFGPGKEEYPRLSPGISIIGREFTETTAQNLIEKGLSPRAAAEAFVNEQHEKYLLNPWVHYWEGTNEPVIQKDRFPWLGEFEKQRILIMANLGLKCVAFNFSTGYPHIAEDDLSWWEPLVPALRTLRDNGGILGLHAYSDHKLTEDPSNILRYRTIHDLVLVPNGLGDLRIALTEFGRTYWRTTQGLTPEQYLSELKEIDSELARDDYLVCATIYTFGHTQGWEDFDVDETIIPQGLAAHIRATKNVPPAFAEGIDVSHHQGEINWNSAKGAGVSFAYIRVSDGARDFDTQFARNWREAKAHGVIRGAYQFFRPSQDPEVQATAFLKLLGTLEPGDLPPALDVETTDDEPISVIHAGIHKWLNIVKSVTGISPIIYTSKGFWNQLGDFSVDAELWVANWTSRPNPALPESWNSWRFWQYRVDPVNTVGGIKTRIDRDRFHGNLEQLKSYAASIVSPPPERPPQLFLEGTRIKIGARGTPPSRALNVRKQPVGGIIGDPIKALPVGVFGTVLAFPIYATLSGNRISWVRAKFDDGTEGYVSQNYLDPVVEIPTQKTNLLRNPGFDSGHYRWHGINEIVIPNEWDFWYQTDRDMRINRQDDPFYPPECVVWNKRDAPDNEKDLFFLSGEFCLKVFKGWGPVWWRLFQEISGLEVGERYRFTVPVFSDLVMRYDGNKKVFADDPLAGEIRLKAGSADTGYQIGLRYGEYIEFSTDFTADQSTALLELEARGRWGLINNGWFVDSLKLEKL